MNKYQEAYDALLEDCYYADRLIMRRRKFGAKHEMYLQELVDKETPMKPIELIDDERSTTHNCCPKCGVEVDAMYCSYCGQKIDWSDEE